MSLDSRPKVVDALNALPRDIARFKTLYPNGEAKLCDNPTQEFAFISSLQMVEEARSSLK